MLKLRLVLLAPAIIFSISIAAAACHPGDESDGLEKSGGAQKYLWTRVTKQAGFPESYNFPLFSVGNRLWAFHHDGNWFSEDGLNWQKASLPALGLNTGYQQYVSFNGAIYGLGTMEGNYLHMKLGSRIARTSADFTKWEVISTQSELPARVFYGAVVFNGKIWMMGGFDGEHYFNDAWNSTDGVHWQRVNANCPWAARSNPSIVVFKDRMLLFGGGVIDGQMFRDVWSSSDGVTWTRVADQMTRTPVFGSAIVYDGKIWLVGINRNGTFRSAMLVSEDGISWTEQDAPWTPRGGVATCVYKGRLYITGGKYSVTENGKIRFIYSNDVWFMRSSPGERAEIIKRVDDEIQVVDKVLAGILTF